ncbi:MAG: lipoprotein, partial [Clostridia bacterium]|nr:lipoprotein [Clostridia bacterium]
MRTKRLLVLITVLALSIVLAACTQTNQAAVTPATSDANITTRVIEHAMGSTEIKGEPERIVILTNEGTEALLELGVKPVGAVKSWTGNPWYTHIEKDMEGVENLGDESQVNIEAIAALNPDLIIGNKMRHEKIYDQLSQIAPTVYSNTLRGEWKENFAFYANVLGKDAKGQEIIQKFDDRATEVSKLAGDKLKTEVSIVRFMAGKTRIYLGDTFSGKILKQIGFARPASQQSEEFTIEIGKERLKEADGQVMFYFTYETGNGEGAAREKEWLQDPMFKTLDVVKNNKVYKVDDAIWN